MSLEKKILSDTVLKLNVELEGTSYPIFLGSGAASHFAKHLAAEFEGRNCVLLMDENTADLFGLLYESELISAGFSVVPLILSEGEEFKNWATCGQILEALAEEKIERTDLLITLGGGVISDMGGFAAAVYLRGIASAQISTTLLAMVDASVGGKTAVNLEAGKNLAGAFKQPRAILMDTDTLATLPEPEFSSGMAEVIKTAVLSGEEFLSWLEEQALALAERDEKVLAQTIERCIEYKASIVARDPFEKREREWLNLGHTLGHGIEKLAGYGEVTHGQAVAEGIRFALRLSSDLLGFAVEDIKRVDNLLDMFGLLPLEMKAGERDVMEAMRSDKKVRSGELRFVLLSNLGSPQSIIIDEMKAYEHLRAWQASVLASADAVSPDTLNANAPTERAGE